MGKIYKYCPNFLNDIGINYFYIDAVDPKDDYFSEIIPYQHIQIFYGDLLVRIGKPITEKNFHSYIHLKTNKCATIHDLDVKILQYSFKK